MENIEMTGKLFELVEDLSKSVEQHEAKIANLQNAVAWLTEFVVSSASNESLENFIYKTRNNENVSVFTTAVKAEMDRRCPPVNLAKLPWSKFPEVSPRYESGCFLVKLASPFNPNTYEAVPCFIVKLALWKNGEFTIDGVDVTSSVKEWSKLQPTTNDQTYKRSGNWLSDRVLEGLNALGAVNPDKE